MNVGDLVRPTKESGFHLRSGAEYYKRAIVSSLEPFVLISEQKDMKWSATVKKEDFELVPVCRHLLEDLDYKLPLDSNLTMECKACGQTFPRE